MKRWEREPYVDPRHEPPSPYELMLDYEYDFESHLAADYDPGERRWPSRPSEFEPLELHEQDEAA